MLGPGISIAGMAVSQSTKVLFFSGGQLAPEWGQYRPEFTFERTTSLEYPLKPLFYIAFVMGLVSLIVNNYG